jgi:muramoyltetrapeptide carboxypeptidase
MTDALVVEMQRVFPKKLVQGQSHIRVIAPSRSLAIIAPDNVKVAVRRLEQLGLRVSFGKHVSECDAFVSSPVGSRLEDLHEAFRDTSVDGILTVIGGFNSNQLLDEIDYELIRHHPKIFCGYSDITALQNAIYTKTGLVTYSGPHFSTFGMEQKFEYTLAYFCKCLFDSAPYEIAPSLEWSDDAWYLDQKKRNFLANAGPVVLRPGEATGCLIGTNLCTLNLLQGTPYMPSLRNAVLCLEDDATVGDLAHVEFDRNLQSLIQLPDFDLVQGLVIGRFQKESNMTIEKLEHIVSTKKRLCGRPIVCNVDFGHTDPLCTLPIGGTIRILATHPRHVSFQVMEH